MSGVQAGGKHSLTTIHINSSCKQSKEWIEVGNLAPGDDVLLTISGLPFDPTSPSLSTSICLYRPPISALDASANPVLVSHSSCLLVEWSHKSTGDINLRNAGPSQSLLPLSLKSQNTPTSLFMGGLGLGLGSSIFMLTLRFSSEYAGTENVPTIMVLMMMAMTMTMALLVIVLLKFPRELTANLEANHIKQNTAMWSLRFFVQQLEPPHDQHNFDARKHDSEMDGDDYGGHSSWEQKRDAVEFVEHDLGSSSSDTEAGIGSDPNGEALDVKVDGVDSNSLEASKKDFPRIPSKSKRTSFSENDGVEAEDSSLYLQHEEEGNFT